MTKPLKDRVREAFRVATEENGYDFLGWTVGEIAADMQKYDSDLEDETLEDLVQALGEISEE